MSESYSGIRELVDFIRGVTKYQQAFWRRYQGTIATLSMDSACPRIFSFYFRLPLPLLPMEKLSFKSLCILRDVFTILFYFLSPIFTPAILGAAILSLALYPNGRVL